MDVDLSLQKTWNFTMDPSNWLKWEDRLEACVFEGTLKEGSHIKAKIKDKPMHIEILITEVRLYQECKCLIKSLFFSQESCYVFQEISPQKTRITLNISIISLLTPFMKKFFLRNVERTRSKRWNAYAEISKQI